MITGSSTTTGGRTSSSQARTAAMIPASNSMPIFTASISTSSLTASSWAVRNSGGGTCMLRTPRVFWATSAVVAAMP